MEKISERVMQNLSYLLTTTVQLSMLHASVLYSIMRNFCCHCYQWKQALPNTLYYFTIFTFANSLFGCHS